MFKGITIYFMFECNTVMKHLHSRQLKIIGKYVLQYVVGRILICSHISTSWCMHSCLISPLSEAKGKGTLHILIVWLQVNKNKDYSGATMYHVRTLKDGPSFPEVRYLMQKRPCPFTAGCEEVNCQDSTAVEMHFTNNSRTLGSGSFSVKPPDENSA